MNKKVVVVGAGIAGLSAAIYLKRSNIDVVVVEKEVPGGLLNKISIVENYPGVKSISGPDLAMDLLKQVLDMNIEIVYDCVQKIENLDNKKILTLKDKTIECEAIILAMGRIPKKYNKTSDELTGKGISYCSICDGPLYKGESVAIIGGGNSALEEALYLGEICKKVTIINRSDKLRGEKGLINKVQNQKNIEIMMNSVVSDFIEKDNKLSYLEINQNGKTIKLDVRACFIFIGYEPNTKFINNLDITDEKGYIIVDEKRKTKIDKIYAAGDIVKKDLFQLVTSASDGALAASACIKDLM